MAEKGKTGHRQRLREQFLAGEKAVRSDEKLLELLLTFAIGRKDVLPLARELLRVFGSLPQVLSASQDELLQVKGIGASSLALLKVVDYIRTKTPSAATKTQTLRSQETEVVQQQLFEHLPEKVIPDQPPSGTTSGKSVRRKLQVSNGHDLDFNHLARLTNAISSHREGSAMTMNDLAEESGLPFRQVRNRVSVARALGLYGKKALQLTALGAVISEYDPFCESIATLEYLHYKAAGNVENLVWYEIFNTLLVHEKLMNYTGWLAYFQKTLSEEYTEYSLKQHAAKEIRFVLDAYLEQHFQKLLLLHQDEEGNIYRRRYTRCTPLVLCAMIYDFCATQRTHFSQVSELAAASGSPALIFGLDDETFRQQIEGLHDRGWLRYESTHNLDQIRLKPGFSALEFLRAHFENREPLTIDD